MTIAVLHLGRTAAGPLLALDLARALIREGEDVVAVYSTDAELADEFASLPIPVLGVSTFRSPVGALAGTIRLPFVARAIRGFLDANGVDTVVVAMEQIWQALLAPQVSRGRMLLLFVHDGTMHDGEHSRIGSWLRRRERRHADGAIALSSHVRDQLIGSGSFPSERVWITVHPAFSLERTPQPRQLPHGRDPVVGFFGRMSRYKGLQLGLDSMTLLRERGYPVQFHIAGANIPGDADGLNESGNIVESRWIPQDEVVPTLEQFDIVLLPYVEASQSGVLGYAMALGIPSVVTPVGGLTEQATASNSAIIADEVTARAVADAVAQLIDDPDGYAVLSRSALDTAATNFSWARVARDSIAAAQSLATIE